MIAKKYCEENQLDPNKVFDMVLGESGSILPKARGFTGYVVEIKDNCLSCTNDKFNVFNKEIPFSSFQRAEFGIGSGQLWLQCVVNGESFVFCSTRKSWKSSAAKLILEKIGEHTEILGMDDYNKIMGKFFWYYLIKYAW